MCEIERLRISRLDECFFVSLFKAVEGACIGTDLVEIFSIQMCCASVYVYVF